MNFLKFCFFSVFLLQSSALRDDTVAEDIVHQLEHLVEMLTSKECKDFLYALSQSEENNFKHLEHLSPENNQLDLQPRAKRDTSAADSEAQCQTALKDWLLRYGEKTYYNRLSRALRHIGRMDIANEVGKNINQEKVLKLKRYVEGYHKYVSSLNLLSDAKDRQPGDQRVKKRKTSKLAWRDLDLIVEQAPIPLYQKGPSDVVLSLLYSLLLGFGVSILTVTALLLITVYISSRRQQEHQQ